MTIGNESFHIACGSSEMKERITAEKQGQAAAANKPRPRRRPTKVGPNWPFHDRHFQAT